MTATIRTMWIMPSSTWKASQPRTHTAIRTMNRTMNNEKNMGCSSSRSSGQLAFDRVGYSLRHPETDNTAGLPDRRTARGSSEVGESRIEIVAHAVTQEVEAEDGQHDRRPR